LDGATQNSYQWFVIEIEARIIWILQKTHEARSADNLLPWVYIQCHSQWYGWWKREGQGL